MLAPYLASDPLPRRRRSKKSTLAGYRPPSPPPPPPPPSGVRIESVSPIENFLVWVFSATVESVDDLAPFEASINGVAYLSPIEYEITAPNAITFRYASPDFPPTTIYRVLTPPTGLTFTNGQPLALPQSGLVTG